MECCFLELRILSQLLRASQLNIFRKGLLLVAVPLAFELLFVGILVHLLITTDHEYAKLAHANEVVTTATTISGQCVQAASCLYLYKLTGDRSMSGRFDDIIAKYRATEQSFKQLIASDTPEQQSIAQKISDLDKLIDQMVHGRDSPRVSPMEVFGTNGLRSKHMQALKELLLGVVDMTDRYRRSIDPDVPLRSRRNVIYWIAGGVALNIVIAIVLSRYFAVEIASRLAVLIRNTRLLADSQRLLPRLSGNDEIAQVDEAFHSTAEALERAKNDRDDLERQRQEFVQMISHEVRTPLSSWLSLLEAITSGIHGKVSDRLIERCNSQKDSAAHTIKLVTDLLELEKLEAGRMPLQKETADLTELVKRARDSVIELAAKSDVSIAIPPDSPHLICADSGRILQVLINLFSNAIRFSPQHSTVLVEIVEVDRSTELSVIDTGRGVPEELQHTIFERYSQVKPEDGSELGGIGLGLPVCKAIVAAHDGAIGVKSDGKHGSTFWFRLPPAQDSRTS